MAKSSKPALRINGLMKLQKAESYGINWSKIKLMKIQILSFTTNVPGNPNSKYFLNVPTGEDVR